MASKYREVIQRSFHICLVAETVRPFNVRNFILEMNTNQVKGMSTVAEKSVHFGGKKKLSYLFYMSHYCLQLLKIKFY
jgi:hypothetical protein